MRPRWVHRLTGAVVRRRPSPELVVLRAMCHELRPPVSVLGSLVRALGDDSGGPVAGNRAEIAELAYEHAVHLESVLRQAAAVTQGMSAATSAGPRVPLHRILPATVAVVPPARLTVEVSPAAGRFEVHGQHTRQVLTNLLENAVRHGPESGSVRLRASTAGRRLRLTVSDEGRLTKEFVKSLRRRNPPADMKGLGLWITRHLVAGAGGSIQARPLDSGGVAVEVTLPPAH
jgi:K+-sensing histidine kinase KdpD